MPIRKCHYQVDYIHILTFKEEYKSAILPYFGFDNLEYAIDNENSIHENIRLIFKNENMGILFRKEAIVLIYEGDAADLGNANGPVKFFWDLLERVKKFTGFKKFTKHHLITYAVDIHPKEEIDKFLENPPFLVKNSFGKLSEVAGLYEFEKGGVQHKFQYGNFSARDIKTHDLVSFKSAFNADLYDSVGIMGRLEVTEPNGGPSFGKFKSLLTHSEKIFKNFDFKLNGHS